MIKKNRDAFERLYVLRIPFKLRAATTIKKLFLLKKDFILFYTY